MNLAYHAGHCCGVFTLWGFDNQSIASLDRGIRAHDLRDAGDRRLLEVVLSERQVRGQPVRGRAQHNVTQEVVDAGGWPALLAQRGFRLVTRFNNSNSNQNCYIFHRLADPDDFLSLEDGDLPFQWEGARAVPNVPISQAPAQVPQQNQPLRVLRSDYANFYRTTGRRGALYETFQAAREAAPRCRRQDRRDIMSDGSVVWHEAVEE